MTLPELTDFENAVNQEILKWSTENAELLRDCNSKQEVAMRFWQHKILPLYDDTSMEIIE